MQRMTLSGRGGMHRIRIWHRKSGYPRTQENRLGKKGIVLKRDGGLSDMPSLSYVIAAVDGLKELTYFIS